MDGSAAIHPSIDERKMVKVIDIVCIDNLQDYIPLAEWT